jgi:hypothetical protein
MHRYEKSYVFLKQIGLNTLQISSKELNDKHESAIANKEMIIEEQSLKMAYMTSEFEGMLNVF